MAQVVSAGCVARSMAEQFIIQNHHSNRHVTLHKMSEEQERRKHVGQLRNMMIERFRAFLGQGILCPEVALQ